MSCLIIVTMMDADLDGGNRIWERRRVGAVKGKRLVKMKEKVKAEQCNSIIVDDDGRWTPSFSCSCCGETAC